MELTRKERAAGALSPRRLEEALRTIDDVGFVAVENAYDLDFIDAVRAAYEVELEKFLQSRGGLEGMRGKTFGLNHIGFFPPLFPPVADGTIAAHPIAVQILTALLGKGLRCSFFHTNTACPGSGIQPVHRDGGSLFEGEWPVTHPVVQMVLNIPLCPFTVENGATQIWPGTHRIADRTPEEGKRLEERAARLPSAKMVLPVGSFVLRDLRMWHRGMPNDSGRIRTMMAIVYQREWLTDGLHHRRVTIPQSTWDGWPEAARHIFRHNPVVPDAEHRPRVWGE